MNYQDLRSNQKVRFFVVVDCLSVGDCLKLVKFFGNAAPDLFKDLVMEWGNKRSPVLYEDAWSLMDIEWVRNFVINGECYVHR